MIGLARLGRRADISTEDNHGARPRHRGISIDQNPVGKQIIDWDQSRIRPAVNEAAASIEAAVDRFHCRIDVRRTRSGDVVV